MHCSDWPHGLGLIDVGLGLARFFWPQPWPRPHTFWPRPWPHDTLASLTSVYIVWQTVSYGWVMPEQIQMI